MDRISQLIELAKQAYQEKDLDQAEKYFLTVIKLDPENIDAHHIIGLIASSTNRNAKAFNYLKKTVSLCDSNPQILYNYGAILHRIGRYRKAADQYEKALSLKPDYLAALLNYSDVLIILGLPTKAEEAAGKIHEVDPSNVMYNMNIGGSFKDQGRIEESLEAYKKLLKEKPDYPIAGSNFLLFLNYSLLDAETIFKEHKDWERRVKPGIAVKRHNHLQLDPDKSPLRIGYISGDFKTHSVAYFFEPILKYHDRSRFEIFCYSDVANEDTVSRRFKKLSSAWHKILDKNNDTVADCIIEDKIDILVDLAGHAGNKRISLFLNRLAPVQVTYLGYPNTTGISTMDYRLTDEWADPEDANAYYTEKLYRLKDGFLCYRPLVEAPPISDPPALKNGYITFGSFNNLPKINQYTVEVWSKILHKVPGSKLFIKTKPFFDKRVQVRYRKLFNSQGIENDRLIFKSFVATKKDHLTAYNKVDIALDTFPYNGTTTTCEALWMGLPIVSLIGQMHAGRVGYSLLSRIGLPSMVVDSVEKYIALAAYLPSDLERLSKLRYGLRSTIAQSPLCAGASFTQTLENAYRDMWEKTAYKRE